MRRLHRIDFYTVFGHVILDWPDIRSKTRMNFSCLFLTCCIRSVKVGTWWMCYLFPYLMKLGSHLDCTCIVHRVFSGTVRSDVTCKNCHFTSTTHEPFLDIALSLPKSEQEISTRLTLLECLNRYVSEQYTSMLNCC